MAEECKARPDQILGMLVLLPGDYEASLTPDYLKLLYSQYKYEGPVLHAATCLQASRIGCAVKTVVSKPKVTRPHLLMCLTGPPCLDILQRSLSEVWGQQSQASGGRANSDA